MIIIFDFDGTLVDSNKIKWESYYKLFPPKKAIKKIVASVDLINGTRWQIIEKILIAMQKSGYQKCSNLQKQIVKLGNIYSNIVENKILCGNGKPGAFATLWKLNKKIPIYINTGTPAAPFKKMVKKLIISGKIPHLSGMYGRKNEKTEEEAKEANFLEIINKEKVSPKEVIFVGDREVDRRTAEKCGCQFIGVADEFNGWKKTKADFPLVLNLKDILKHISF